MSLPDPEPVALVALARACAARGIPGRELSAALERAGSARAVLDGIMRAIPREARVCVAARQAATDAHAAERLAAWSAAGLRLTSVLDPGYPPRLRALAARPPLLWHRGGELPDPGALAVVGTRSPSPRGRAEAHAFATALAQAGVTVVSGLARGIDTEAHRAALAAGARTVAVLGHGLATPIYPSENAALAAAIAEQGALVSQWDPDERPAPARFRARNAVIAGLGAGSLVIEAGVRSGARLEARLAAEQGRPVYLTRTLIQREPWARAFAAGHGAIVVDGGDDLLAHIRRAAPPGPAGLPRAGGPQLRFDDPPPQGDTSV